MHIIYKRLTKSVRTDSVQVRMQAAHEGINYVSIIHLKIHLTEALFLKFWYKNNILNVFAQIFCVKVGVHTY